MAKKDIALIAPYAGLAEQARRLTEEYGEEFTILEGDLYEGVKAARDALAQGAKVIVSRGGTAQLIRTELREELRIDVIEIEASVYNLIGYLHANASKHMRVAVAGFRPFAVMGRAVCDNLGIVYRVFEITDEQAVPDVAEEILDWDADVVVGDAVSQRFMGQRPGLHFHLIETSLESLREAFDRALLVLGNLNRQIVHTRKLSTVLACSLQGIAVLDDRGIIEDMNRQCLDLLGLGDGQAVGRLFAEVVADPDIGEALRDKRELHGCVVDSNGGQLIIDVVPLARTENSGDGGMVMTVQAAERIREMENTIRTRLHKKGFFARRRLADIAHVSESVRHTIAIAEDYAKSEANIVITGETGTGKELFAQGIHNASARSGGMFVAVNCAALPASLLESELFGYSPGAFTGAAKTGKPGLFEMAHRGTLFLDEISEMDPFLQTRLLRAIQEREIMRLGDSRIIPVDVRIVAAANKDLEEEVDKGNLRLDLFFRLNVLSLRLPPLRERKGDVEMLLRHYLAKHAARMGVRLRQPDTAFFRNLEGYSWPGNVRELENMAERYVVLQDRPESGDIRSLLPRFAGVSAESAPSRESVTLDDIVRNAVVEALAAEGGNIQRASRRLGVNRNTVKRWMRSGD